MKSQVVQGYELMMEQHELKKSLPKNFAMAFIWGGALCAAAQLMFNLFVQEGGYSQDTAAGIVLIIVIGVTALITGLGFYDRLGQIAGAGLAVPISGFANSMTAAAIDDRSEGFVQGVASGSFKLAGAVVVFGSVSAFFVAVIYWIGGFFV